MNVSPVLALSLATICAQAQEPAFEAASIKVSPPVQHGMIVDGVPTFRQPPRIQGGPGTEDPGRITCIACPLSLIIAAAYEVTQLQIRSSRDLGLGEYDVIAKVPPGSTRHQVNLMLRQLLVERFQLVVHSQKQDALVYVLLIGKQGPKFRSSGDSEASAERRPALLPTLSASGFYTVTGKHRSMQELADALTIPLRRPIIDKTDLKDNYDFLLAWMPNERLPQPKKSELPAGIRAVPYSLETAVQLHLGLKLETQKMPVDMLIIDSAKSAPTEN
jgi:uncharacterized protein (TIGR03435 family)